MPCAHPPQPNLEHLDDRLVPSATVLNLTTAGAEASAPSGAIVQQCDAQPTGTGFIRAFVRVQGAAPGGGTQQGYNTDGRPLQFDENKSPQFTRSITLGQVPVVNVGGTEYRQFLLDINQKSSAPMLSLDEVRVFLSESGNLTNYNVAAKTLDGKEAAFDLDEGCDVSVKLNYRLNSGSGSGDMYLLVPNSAFDGKSASNFVYLYSKFGGLSGASANSGFEEWAVRSTPPAQPPAATGSLSGFVYLYKFDMTMDRWVVDQPLAGVTISLMGTDIDGNTVVMTTTTGLDGSYTFTGLAAGTYTLAEEQPANYTDGEDFLGTIDGVAGGMQENDKFFDINLGVGQNGVNYIFTERPGE